jgi:hypothetical protein
MSEVSTSIKEEDGKVHISRTQDIQRILDWNKERSIEGHNRKSDFRHAGRIPNVVVEMWLRESGLKLGSKEFQEYVKKKLMTGDYGRLIVNGY